MVITSTHGQGSPVEQYPCLFKSPALKPASFKAAALNAAAFSSYKNNRNNMRSR